MQQEPQGHILVTQSSKLLIRVTILLEKNVQGSEIKIHLTFYQLAFVKSLWNILFGNVEFH